MYYYAALKVTLLQIPVWVESAINEFTERCSAMWCIAVI